MNFSEEAGMGRTMAGMANQQTASSQQNRSLIPPHRYRAELAGDIELSWQRHWEDHHTWEAPNPTGKLAESTGEPTENPARLGQRPTFYILDMFPYPSGSGLHVGHPLGYIATDVYGRFLRMCGYNVLHAFGYDAFGLPAEQFAMQSGQHPRVTTQAAIATFRRQLRRLGLAHDFRREVATTDVDFYRWTQWIFLRIFNSWYDADRDKARPIDKLIAEFSSGVRPTPDRRPWAELTAIEQRQLIDAHRLAYRAEAPVNWCPGLGTVLANEEVTPDGRSVIGNFPVYRRPLTQWMMRITAYAERLLGDLEGLDWPESIKMMQCHWIGRSQGARIVFLSEAGDVGIEVFTTRPDTLFGVTYLVLAPEHPLVDVLGSDAWPAGTPASWTQGHLTPRAAVEAYRKAASRLSERERVRETRTKTGIFLGASARNPATGQLVPIFLADYVLPGYGTGAIMAVPAHDERDFTFAHTVGLPLAKVVEPPADWPAAVGDWATAFTGQGVCCHSGNAEVSLDGMPTVRAISAIIAWLESTGAGQGAITYKLRDWLFSRQRYWGEPFPIVYDETGLPVALPESMLPVTLPDVDDYAPRAYSDDEERAPEPPLARAKSWATVSLDLGDGLKTYQRELNTMPQWAGSCWYYLRYLDPANTEKFVDPEVERYWMGGSNGSPRPGGVDLYVGGAEHAVLHLLYSRFWHKVLYDLGHVSTPEPFQRLFNQGMIQAAAYTDERGFYVDAAQVVEHSDGTHTYQNRPVTREYGKMGKSLKNSVDPDDIYASYGADTLRLYEMAMGPLDTARPWSTTDIIGVHRLLQRAWRAIVDEETGVLRVLDAPPDIEIRRATSRAIDAVRTDMAGLRFNTAIAKITELLNSITKTGVCHRETAETLTLLLAPLAPHIAEELWSRLGHPPSVGWQPFPHADPALLAEERVTLVVQINGKLCARLEAPADADAAAVERAALDAPRVQTAVAGRTVRRVITRPPTLVNVVV